MDVAKIHAMDTGSICRLSGQNVFTHRWEQHNLELVSSTWSNAPRGVVQELRPVRPLAVEGDGQNGIGVGPYYGHSTAKFASTLSITGAKIHYWDNTYRGEQKRLMPPSNRR